MKTGREKLQTLHRWAKFSAVGLLGFCVQISAVYLFLEVWKLGTLVATALAVEAAVVHNFAWHHLLTWSDRPVSNWHKAFQRLLAFNVTSGVVSLAGNLLFAWLIVERGHISLLAANLVAVSVSALANFILSDKVVFRSFRSEIKA